MEYCTDFSISKENPNYRLAYKTFHTLVTIHLSTLIGHSLPSTLQTCISSFCHPRSLFPFLYLVNFYRKIQLKCHRLYKAFVVAPSQLLNHLNHNTSPLCNNTTTSSIDLLLHVSPSKGLPKERTLACMPVSLMPSTGPSKLGIGQREKSSNLRLKTWTGSPLFLQHLLLSPNTGQYSLLFLSDLVTLIATGR